MSEPVTAVGNATYMTGIAEIAEIGPMGMITVRGDLSNRVLRNAVGAVSGADMPGQREIKHGDDHAVAWMSPDELLVMCPYAETGTILSKLHSELSSQHALAVNVSDARALFEVRGAHAREVLAKLAPVDLSSAAFNEGMIRRTRMAQVPAAFWMTDKDTFRVVCFRSVGQYMFDLLKAAAQPGSEVEQFA